MANKLPDPELYLVRAFSSASDGGNAAGVVLHADSLAREQKQMIAANLGLTETAFVSSSVVGDAKVEFFTPNRQIPHCGHATVATFGLLQQKGLVSGDKVIKESIEGPREILLIDNKIYQSQLKPEYHQLREYGVNVEDVALSLGLPHDYAFMTAPMVVSTGVPFLLVQVPLQYDLASLQPDMRMVEAVSEKIGLVGYYVFTTEAGAADATTRMFAPAYGIPEESATGMAAGPLACYLYEHLQVRKQDLLIHQGYLMPEPSPSQIEVKLELNEQGNITGLKAGGYAYVVERLELKF